MVNANRIVEEFLELVRVDSVSGKERQIADLLKNKLISLGLDVYEDNAGEIMGTEAGNIIGRLAGEFKGPVLMLCAHMDTVEPGLGIKPIIEQGIIKTSGDTILGADDKAGIVAILEVIRLIKEYKIGHSGIEVVFTVWEEGGLYGAKNLDYNLVKSEMGFVLDSDGVPGTIITSAPSQDKIGVTIKGKAAHAGINPEDGVNAIQVASHAISRMVLGRIDHETTANIGFISGGKATNIIPDSVNLEGETRSLDDKKREIQTSRICRAIRMTSEEFGAVANIVVDTVYPGFKMEKHALPVRIAVQAAKNLGIMPGLVNTGGGSDANIFNSRGINTAVLGIGMKKMHSTEEYIEIKNLIKNAVYLLEIIKVSQSTLTNLV